MRPYVLLLSLFAACEAYTNCDKVSVTNVLKKPIYDFSQRILDRVSMENDGNFVFSPISTWLQLRNIAEGARGHALRELWKVTGQRSKPCLLRTMRMILNDLEKDTGVSYKTQSLVMVDKVMRVNRNFKKKLELSNNVKVMSLNFNKDVESANIANAVIEKATDGKITDAVDPYDFNLTMFVMTDVASFSKPWARPFNPAYTKREDFFYKSLPIGEVNMMSQVGNFNYTKLEQIDSEVLELPSTGERYSLLVFLPLSGDVKDIFWNMKKIRIATLFNLFKSNGERLVNVKLPRFKIETEVNNLPELVNDMGVGDIFMPKRAKLRGISDYDMVVSALRQRAVIDVTEEGVSALSESIITSGDVLEFAVNRPFGFMLVDKSTQIILFAGMYDEPSLY